MNISLWKFIVLFLFIFSSANAQKRSVYNINPIPDNWMCQASLYEQQLPVNDQWWRVFESPTLDSLIVIAINQNPDVMTAMNRIEKERAGLRIAKGSYYPSFNLGIGWDRNKTSGNISQSIPEAYSGYYYGAVSMSWEVDVFGKIRSKVKAQKQTYYATQAEYNATMVALCAEVGTAYFNYLENMHILDVLKRNAQSQKGVVKITEARFDVGLASKLDVAQAKSIYYSTLASIPQTESAITQFHNSLAILLGMYPQNIILGNNHLPDYIEAVGVGIPAQLLLRRPDVRVAEYNINTQAALLGAAKKEWFPTFLLNGSFGYSSNKLKNQFEKTSMTWEIAPSMTWTIFSGGARANRIVQQRALLDQTINQFNSTILTAVQEVDNAMNMYKNSIKQIAACRQMVFYGKEAFLLSLDLYKQGLSEFQNVLDAQRSLLTYENALVQARAYSLKSLILLYQALGGGWGYSSKQ